MSEKEHDTESPKTKTPVECFFVNTFSLRSLYSRNQKRQKASTATIKHSCIGGFLDRDQVIFLFKLVVIAQTILLFEVCALPVAKLDVRENQDRLCAVNLKI